MARLLLKHGADVSARGGEGQAPLDWANSHPWKYPAMVKLLREQVGKK